LTEAGGVLPPVLGLAEVRALYARGLAPSDLFAALERRIDAADPAVFITRSTPAMIAKAIAGLLARAPVPNSLPLWGVPFAVKDNIDVAGLPTTCACPAFARMADDDAVAVARMIAAGAIAIGKTNLDQFATGLNGTRTPYGVPHSVFSQAHISGGSSSGSALAVAAGLASFALGTDTAGSGRVPAALNNIVGIKPTPGLVSTRGMVPACASLDCLSIFALSVADGATLRELVEGFDPADPWSAPAIGQAGLRPPADLRIGVLAAQDREFAGHADNARLYAEAIGRSRAEPVEIDFSPFRETAALLYEGPWVAERLAAFTSFGLPDSVLDPALTPIFARAKELSAADAFRGFHALQALRRRCAAELARVDALLLPTVPATFTIAEMREAPIVLNATLGLYTNFCNLLGLAAIAVPAGFDRDGLPFGVMLVGPGGSDAALVPLAHRLHMDACCGAGIVLDFVLPDLLGAFSG
jgi:allophanate hydrolase